MLVTGISFITRLALLIKAAPGFDWTIANVLGTFVIGLFFDLAMASFFIIPYVLLIWLRNDFVYQKPRAFWIAAILIVLVALLAFTPIIPDDFNAALRTALLVYLAIRLVIYIMLVLAPASFRNRWRKGILYFYFFLTIFFLCFNAVSEWFFWDEFSSRYNFIAVDYLVYTTEVMGNIQESYPITAIVLIVLAISLLIFFLLRPALKSSLFVPMPFVMRTIISLVLIFVAVLTFFGVNEKWRNFSANEYANQLAGNGIFQFGNAYWQNNLDFFKFYKTLPDQEAFTILRQQLASPNAEFISDDVFDIRRRISYAGAERKYNVVLISVESLSASYMKRFGGEKNITPYLDSLAGHSLFFTNLYASGTRTVRGLEALSLSIPPTPGQSIIKRPGNENLFSMASVLNKKGYTSQFIYGGYSYFDNMGYFFAHNGYEVLDRDNIEPSKIHYQNIWGVADEDLFTLALETMDKNAAMGKPFFSHVMTVSNHRPYTYPENRVPIGPENQSREGAVQYTDYAINKFLKEASQKPWFDSSVFIIVSDHCAASAGSVELPVTGYHIPMLIYAPKIIQPGIFDRLTAQIDVVPTVMGILNLNYTSKFLGRDILHDTTQTPYAFISTYQGLGFLTENHLVIQKPLKQVETMQPDFANGKSGPAPAPEGLINTAISFYQAASWLLSKGKYNSE